jgi:hypothetical protein
MKLPGGDVVCGHYGHDAMRTETRKSLREANAHHEAGHAVIAYALGYKPTSATIVPSRSVRGIVSLPNPLRGIKLDIDGSDRARLRGERAIQICLAGPLAQRHYRRSSWRRYHGGSDFDTARLHVCGSGEQATAFLRWLEITTRERVKTYWVYIARVAALLLKRESLTGQDILSALQPSKSALRRAHERQIAICQRRG